MRIQILSDLHFEFHPDRGRAFVDALDSTGVDVLVIAGDLAPVDTLVASLAKFYRKYSRVVFIAGNHEFYGSSPAAVERKREDVGRELRSVHWLENDCVEIGGIRFVGSTLWFDDLGGRKNYINDFRMIADFEPWVYARFRASRDYLQRTVREGDVVVTHYLPSQKSVAKQFARSPLNCFFVSDVEQVIRERRPRLWLHGHTHASCDYAIGGTRVACNPYGYHQRETNERFEVKKVFDVERGVDDGDA